MRPSALSWLAATVLLLIILYAGCSPVAEEAQGLSEMGECDAGTDEDADAGCDGGCEGTCTFRSGIDGRRTQLVSMSCSDGCGCPATRTSGACVKRVDGCMTEALLDQLGDDDYQTREDAQAKIAACCTDSIYLSWLQGAPQNRSSDPEVARRMATAVLACRRAVDPCSVAGGGTLVSVQETCMYDYTATGMKKEPYFECIANSPTEYKRVYHAMCAASDVGFFAGDPCNYSVLCPRPNTFAMFEPSATSEVLYASEAACEAGPPDDNVIQYLFEYCSSGLHVGSINVRVDGCDQGGEPPRCL